jgi:hypothetical protein
MKVESYQMSSCNDYLLLSQTLQLLKQDETLSVKITGDLVNLLESLICMRLLGVIGLGILS